MASETRTPRRTQQERSEETKRRLLDATVECLVKHGYAHTTTTLVCDKAGVSRGALLHHFPRKADLVRAAIEHTFDKRLAEYRAAMARVPEGAGRMSAAIDHLWEAYSAEDSFHPSLEFMVAARTDPEIRPALLEMTSRIVDAVRETFDELFEAETSGSPFAEIAPSFAMVVMDGLALARLAGLDDEGVRQILDALRLVAALAGLAARDAGESGTAP